MNLPGITEGFIEQGKFTPENLIAGEYPRIVRIVTLATGMSLPQGAILGRIEADGRYQLSDAGESNGSEVPDAILAENVDATAVDTPAHVFMAGEFNAHALTLGPGHTLNSVTQALRLRSIFIRHNQA